MPAALLTRRQRDVTLLVSRGATNREIGRALGLSERTVETYITRILRQLQLRSRTELAVWANSHRQLGTMTEESIQWPSDD